ncbi:Homocitrate synthase [Paramyrothecium foliicola]|nr:Homocitrate synthase [Paramyrothecium foliicola]
MCGSQCIMKICCILQDGTQWLQKVVFVVACGGGVDKIGRAGQKGRASLFYPLLSPPHDDDGEMDGEQVRPSLGRKERFASQFCQGPCPWRKKKVQNKTVHMRRPRSECRGKIESLPQIGPKGSTLTLPPRRQTPHTRNNRSCAKSNSTQFNPHQAPTLLRLQPKKMASRITHHTSHTMGEGASSSNSGSNRGGGSSLTVSDGHALAEGPTSSADGAAPRGGDVVSGSADDGNHQGHAPGSSPTTTPTTNLQDLTLNTNANTESGQALEFAHDDDDASSVGTSSPCPSESTDDRDDGTVASGLTSMESSVNLPTWSIIDTTLREGEQFATSYFNTEMKMKIARALDDFGVEGIELTSPAASQQSRDDCAAICKMGLKAKIMCHIRCNMDDARIAVETGVDGINMCIGTSSQLMTHSHGKDMKFIAAKAKEVIEYVKSKGIEIRFSGEDSFRSDFNDIINLYSLVDSYGANRVGIADTVGGATPMEVYDKISTLRRAISCDIETHFHNDLGCATANAQIAIEAGATHLNTTVLGIGERNGITPLGRIVKCLMPVHGQAISKKYNLEKLAPLEKLVAECCNIEIPWNNPVLTTQV